MLTEKRSIDVNGRRTSVSIEDHFWRALRDISRLRRTPLREIVSEIDRARSGAPLTSAIRVRVLEHFQTMAMGGV